MTSTSAAYATDDRTSYKLLAAHYDAFTDHPAHPEWFGRLEALARRHGLRGKRALDVGCGSGRSTLALVERGYDVVGCDPCAEMLALAERRLPDRVPLTHAPAQELPQLGHFDYISCVGDICNYMLEPAALGAAFRGMAANLADDGILLFDANTPLTYRTFFGTIHYSSSAAGKMICHGFDPDKFTPNGIVEETIEIFEPDGELWRLRATRHAQRHHDHDTIRELLDDADLRIDGLYGQTDAGPPEQPVDTGRHTKAIYLVKR